MAIANEEPAPPQAATVCLPTQLSPEISCCAFTYALVSYKMQNQSNILILTTGATLNINTPQMDIVWKVEQRNHAECSE